MALAGDIDFGVAVNQAKVEVLSSLSNKVRTPISVVLGNTEMIMRETGESHTATYAMNIQAAARTMLLMMNDIVDLSNIQKGTLKLEEASFSMLSLLQDVIAYAEYSTDEKHLELRLDIDEKLPRGLCGDAIRLTQIFNNLLSNAIKYTSEGFVELSVRWQTLGSGGQGEYGILTVRVRDSGIGMKKETIDRISSGQTVDKKKDVQESRELQLGIFIIESLLDLMGSKLQIESEYGKGSTFSFCIVQKIIDPAPVGKRKSREAHHVLQQMQTNQKLLAPNAKILVVDDSTMNQNLFRGVLKDSKIKIDTAFNGEEALKKLQEEHYHLAFMDHMMPVMDGIEALKRIRSGNLCPGIPVVALTANMAPGAKEMYLEEGFDEYLSKPVSPKQLEAVIKRYLPKELIQEKEESRHTEEKEQEEVSTQQEKSAFLQKVSFLDTSVGMSYFADNEDFYHEMIQCYLDNSSYEDIQKSFDNQDWENYRILVHALKSTSLSIGAVELSNQAKELEFAAKEGRIDDIYRGHDAMITRYHHLLEQIHQVLGEVREEKEETLSIQEDKACILVVDDDMMNLRIAEKMLESQFHIECVKSGGEALEFVEKVIPNLILLDLHMPGMDGFQVIEALRAKEQYRDIPVIFLTADNDRETEVKGFREGALDFITKPFIADIAISRVNRILELSRLQKDLQREVKKQTRTAEERRQKVERLSNQIMKTLAGTIDAKDKYKKGHSSRVAEYAVEIAKKLGKSPKEQENIYYLGLLHDIGKIGIPDGIINKTSKLTDEEYELIKTHSIIGAEILENISELPELVMGARWHHERYDGSGYPDKLKGDKIPEMARIIGVADAYDAMTSKRSYRDVLPQNVVRAEIEKGKGSQFDPIVADKMLEMIDEDTEYLMKER